MSVVLSRRERAKPIIVALESGRLTLVVSEQTLGQTDEVLRRPALVRTGEARLLAHELMNTIKQRAEFVSIAGDLAVCRDPTDDMFIEVALAGNVDVLVSQDNDLLEDPPVTTVAQMSDRPS